MNIVIVRILCVVYNVFMLYFFVKHKEIECFVIRCPSEQVIRVITITSYSDYRPNVILEHSFSLYHGEFTDGLVPGKSNVNEYL